MSQFIEMFGDQNTNDKGWSESLVKDEFKLSMGKTPARNNPECWDNGNHKWVSISDMSSYARYTGDTSEYITDYAIADSGIKPVPKGTIIMSFKLSIGRTAITSEDIYTNEAIMAFADFDEKKFNIDFLHFLIANKNWLLGAKQAVKGQTLNKESIGNAKIIIPPIEMQEQFASIYNQADKSKFVGFKSQFIDMFKNIPSVKIADCCITVSGGTPNTKKIEYYDGGDIPWLSSGEINQGYIFSTDKYITQLGLENSSAKWVPANSVVIAMYGATAGKVGFIKIPLTTNQAVCTLLPNDGFEPLYLYYATLSKTSWMISQCRGAAQPNISQSIIRSMEIPMATIDEQKQFCKLLTQADKSEYYN